MALNMSLEVTSGVAQTDYSGVEADLVEAYATLSRLPANRQLTVDFATKGDANLFVRQGKAWAAAQEPVLTFARKGNVKENPTRVSFRIYVPRAKDSEDETPGADSE